MPIFLIPLAIALTAIYVQHQAQEEIIIILARIFAALGLLVSFSLAPWLVQILVLAIAVWEVWWCCCCQKLR